MNAGIAIAARTPTMATTTMSSTSVKPARVVMVRGGIEKGVSGVGCMNEKLVGMSHAVPWRLATTPSTDDKTPGREPRRGPVGRMKPLGERLKPHSVSSTILKPRAW
jgi:hypothetical protein